MLICTHADPQYMNTCALVCTYAYAIVLYTVRRTLNIMCHITLCVYALYVICGMHAGMRHGKPRSPAGAAAPTAPTGPAVFVVWCGFGCGFCGSSVVTRILVVFVFQSAYTICLLILAIHCSSLQLSLHVSCSQLVCVSLLAYVYMHSPAANIYTPTTAPPLVEETARLDARRKVVT
jgi:hypothetical protein